ncbi:predicted protein [Naegleria gruberi]|uniref:Predicted protein n=1 Tax=Naegleria gruberi TaxID=5762 RepID=D2W6U5_NAEGR|nr:uncharacterized protein NAEGRDRAFT_77139 [Naegleria gruberi]EFC35207.1 predicted protein [Naegleria gruberi]|eukprot:XP_002667951.1 predicted protein [Naegleria gruberi strain NEG-M]
MQNASRADWHSIRAVPAPLPGRLPRPCSAPCPAPLHPHTGQHDGKAHQHQGRHPGGGDRLRRQCGSNHQLLVTRIVGRLRVRGSTDRRHGGCQAALRGGREAHRAGNAGTRGQRRACRYRRRT